jgi:outer membrane protein OmpA-like peptidoglycan-associated protein
MKFVILLLLSSVSFFAQEKVSVFFDFNKDNPKVDSEVQFTKWMDEHKNVEILELVAFCDSVDANSYNKDLATRRMQTVLTVLKQNNFSISATISLKAVGEDFKQSKNQAENRKVEVFYKTPIIKNTTFDKSKVIENEEAIEESLNIPLVDLFKNIKVGDLIRIQNINFYLNSEVVIPQSESVLEELYIFMLKHPKLVIEIQGHICCNPNINDTRLSFRRAKYIFNYLLKKGIELNRLAYRGFGSANPIYQIPEQNIQQKQANRRVEILIVRNGSY